MARISAFRGVEGSGRMRTRLAVLLALSAAVTTACDGGEENVTSSPEQPPLPPQPFVGETATAPSSSRASLNP